VALPKQKIVIPRPLKGVKHGFVPAEMLVDIKPYGKLYVEAAQAWMTMKQAAKKDGIVLKPTSSGDTYRSYEMQERAFLQRYQKEPIAGASTRTWNGVKWYLKSPKLAPLAAPGGSWHNLGLAVDCHSASGPILAWLVANEEKYGFCHELDSEPWHIVFFGTKA
jgi:LAS superfamily LD-carboxypeptidase LdcB